MEGDVIITQDLFVYDMIGEDAQRQPDRPPPLDRHRPPALLGARPLLRRGEAARRRARRRRNRRASRLNGEPPWTSQMLALFVLVAGRDRRHRLGLPLSAPVRRDGRPRSGTASVARTGTGRARDSARSPQKSRREQVEETLKELESSNKKHKKLPLRCTHRAGRPHLVEAAVLLIIAGVSASSPSRHSCSRGLGLLVGARRSAFAAAFGLPRWISAFSRSGARTSFSHAFPGCGRRDRARHQGRPAAARLPEDHRAAKRRSRSRANSARSSRPSIGMPLGEACAKLYERMPLPEANSSAS